MKLTAVNNSATNQNKYNKNNINNKTTNQNNVHFTNAADTLVSFWRFIDNGGRGYQFTVEDMCGTNFPRTYAGAMSSYKYTGKINIPALLQEAIREFLTGPTMTFAPIAVLAGIIKASGRTADTHVENIENLSYIATQLKAAGKDSAENLDKSTFEDTYYRAVAKDLLAKSSEVNEDILAQKGKGKKDIETIVDGIKKYSQNQTKISTAKTRSAKKAAKKQGEEILANLQETYESIIKRRNTDYKGIDFQNTKYSLSATEVGETNFKNYVKYASAFAEDYTKTNAKKGIVQLGENTIKQFRKDWIGKRIATVVSMISLTSLAMMFIPKIYTLASGKNSPVSKSVRDEAARKEGN